MIGNFLNNITDMGEYRLILRVLNSENENFSDEEQGEILKIYGKFMPDVKNDITFRAFAVLDTANTVEELEKSPLKELVTEEVLTALEQMGAVCAEKLPSSEAVNAALCLSDGVLKNALCRLMLDKLAAFLRQNDNREGVLALSAYLKAAEEGALYDASLLVAEVKNKWR